jgi:hypothetical protein
MSPTVLTNVISDHYLIINGDVQLALFQLSNAVSQNAEAVNKAHFLNFNLLSVGVFYN